MKKIKKKPRKERLNKNTMSKSNKYDVYGEINGIGEAIDANSKTKLTNKSRDDLDHDVLIVEMKLQLKEEVTINEDVQTKVFSKAMNERWISKGDDANVMDNKDGKPNHKHHNCKWKGKKAFQCERTTQKVKSNSAFAGNVMNVRSMVMRSGISWLNLRMETKAQWIMKK